MDDDSATGCAIVVGILLAVPFFIAAIPVLAGITAGAFFYFVVVPLLAWFIARILGMK